MENETNENDRRESSRIDALYGLVWQPRVPLFDNPSPQSGSPGSTCGAEAEPVKTDQKRRLISRDAEDVLIRAKRKPFLTITQLYKDVGLSGYKGNKSKQELVRAGLADEVELPANRRGRRKKLLQVTPRGNEYLKGLGVRVEAKGRGGVKHLYYQKRIREWYESRGYTAEIEARVGETSFDVLAIGKGGRRIGIEIALSAQYEDINAKKARASGVECVLFVCETKGLQERLRHMLGAIGDRPDGPRYGLKLVSDYLGDE